MHHLNLLIAQLFVYDNIYDKDYATTVCFIPELLIFIHPITTISGN